jgi:hypothetical protein
LFINGYKRGVKNGKKFWLFGWEGILLEVETVTDKADVYSNGI